VSKKKKEHHEEHIDETWLIPYADLLTLLLALFIVLFASSSVDAKKFDQLVVSLSSAFNGGTSFLEPSSSAPISDAPVDNTNKTPAEDKRELEKKLELDKKQQELFKKETLELEKLKKKLDEYIRQNGLKTVLETKLTNYGLKIIIRDSALFASGSAQVRPEAKKLAVAISDMLVPHPKQEVLVAGYTDNRPINTREFADNWDLSSKRALNFMKILLENAKLEPIRFSATGYGEYRPITTNGTEEGRALNRRVEVSILRNFKVIENVSK
jgi:chemotaxis protein MotB